MSVPIIIEKATYPDDLREIRNLFREYQDEIQADLCFQSFEEELDNLPGKYAEPEGVILLARKNEHLAGIIALRPLDSGVCEMKRLYVRPEFKGEGLGRKLAESIMELAKKRGYKKMLLDTLDRLAPAVALYRSLGFQDREAYYGNPLEGVVYMELDL